MRRLTVAIVLLPIVLLLGLMMLACGGSSTSTTTSGFKTRAFVSNATALGGVGVGEVEVVNTATDGVAANVATVAAQPSVMAVSPDHTVTAVFSAAGPNTLSVITNSSEALTGSFLLANVASSLVLRDASIGYAAIRNANTGNAQTGAVAVLDLKNFVVASTIPVPLARTLVISPSRTKLLVFSDNSDSVTVIDTSTNAPLAPVGSVVSGFNRPVFAVFKDDTTAFVMNCGTECGGAAPDVNNRGSVQLLTIGSTTGGTPAPVDASSVGLLNGNTLYVAGTKDGTAGQGFLNVLDVSSGNPAPTAVQHVPISDGLHTLTALGSNNKLFVGSTNCINTGCLTIFDASANTATIVPNIASVTSMVPVPGRSVVYVVQGGALGGFSTTTNLESGIFIDGQAYDVKLVDQ